MFGDSEDEEEADYVVRNKIDEEQNVCTSATHFNFSSCLVHLGI